MKSTIACACLGALLVLSAQAQSPVAAPVKGGLRYTINVTKFDDKSGYAGKLPLTSDWAACLTDSLQNTGRFIVIAENDMRAAAISEQDFAKSGRAANGDKAPGAHSMTPAQLIVKGEITAFQDGTQGSSGGIGFAGLNLGLNGSKAEINAVIYIVDTTTGQVLASKKVVGVASNSGLNLGFAKHNLGGNLAEFKNSNVGKAVEAAIDQAVTFLIGQLPSVPWTGSVILVNGDKIFINRGEREGVAPGELFTVGSSQSLRDPSTGELLDTTFTKMGQIRVNLVREKISICSVVSGGPIGAGMSIAP